MKVYALVARDDDYYTSLTPLGVFSTFDKADDALHAKFADVQFSTDPYSYWIFDSYLCNRDIIPTKQFTGKCIHEGSEHKVNIAILEMELDNDILCRNSEATEV